MYWTQYAKDRFALEYPQGHAAHARRIEVAVTRKGRAAVQFRDVEVYFTFIFPSAARNGSWELAPEVSA